MMHRLTHSCCTVKKFKLICEKEKNCIKERKLLNLFFNMEIRHVTCFLELFFEDCFLLMSLFLLFMSVIIVYSSDDGGKTKPSKYISFHVQFVVLFFLIK